MVSFSLRNVNVNGPPLLSVSLSHVYIYIYIYIYCRDRKWIRIDYCLWIVLLWRAFCKKIINRKSILSRFMIFVINIRPHLFIYSAWNHVKTSEWQKHWQMINFTDFYCLLFMHTVVEKVLFLDQVFKLSFC